MQQKELSDFSSTGEPCPWNGCERVFDTRKGVKIHHKAEHGISIAGPESKVDCEWCESTITRYKSKIDDGRGNFCDKDCKTEWQRVNQSGEKHNQYGRVEVECEWCGGVKKVPHCRTTTRNYYFCDDSCKGDYISANLGGIDHPRYSRVEVDCDWCGEPKSLQPSRAERYDHHFCPAPPGEVASDCYRLWRSETFRGSDHPSWRGGRETKLYRAIRRSLGPRSWSWVKKEFWEDEETLCAMPNCDGNIDEYKQHSNVHHIIPVLLGGVNDQDNLLPLCPGCHRGVEHYTQHQLGDYIPDALVDYTIDELPKGRIPPQEFQKMCLATSNGQEIRDSIG